MSIAIKYYPVRFGKECKQQNLDFSRNFLVKDYLMQVGLDPKDVDIIIEGKVVKVLDVPVDNQSEIIVTPKIEIGALAAGIGWLIHGIWVGLVTPPFFFGGGILFTAYSVYSAVSAARKRNFGTTSIGLDESSPTYGLDLI